MTTSKPDITEAEPSAIASKHKSKGERVFDWAVYGGIAGVGTFLATVPLTYVLKYSNAGGKYYEGFVDIIHKGLKKVTPGLMSRKVAEDAAMTSALMMGGNAMIWPVAVAEKHKVQTVSGLNIILGDKTPPERIEQQPKQTWGSLLKARLTAWGTVFAAIFTASSLFPKSFSTFENEFAERVCKLIGKPEKILVDGKHVPSRAFLFGKISALDVFATAAAATLLYVAGHTFARRREARKAGPQSDHRINFDQADAAQVDAPSRGNGPGATLVGERSHEGIAQHRGTAVTMQL